jgi:transcriptional regulator of acetoin/glycerol metabolism
VLQRALLRVNGNVTAAAKSLGVSRATLHRKLKRFDLRAH